jgi:hypothetical protein
MQALHRHKQGLSTVAVARQVGRKGGVVQAVSNAVVCFEVCVWGGGGSPSPGTP